jgi:hypothetical protein
MRTAIVCCAPYMRGSGYGAEIDTFDRVVRVNTGFEMIDIYPDDLGRKTHVCYINRYLYNRKVNYPSGVSIVTKRHIADYTEYKGYEANTGILALVHFVTKGDKCKVFGMDFYSGVNNGTIPLQSITKDNGADMPIVSRDEVYMPGYKVNHNDTVGQTFALYHAGYMRDFKILSDLMDSHGVTVDDHLAKIVEINKPRIALMGE